MEGQKQAVLTCFFRNPVLWERPGLDTNSEWAAQGYLVRGKRLIITKVRRQDEGTFVCRNGPNEQHFKVKVEIVSIPEIVPLKSAEAAPFKLAEVAPFESMVAAPFGPTAAAEAPLERGLAPGPFRTRNSSREKIRLAFPDAFWENLSVFHFISFLFFYLWFYFLNFFFLRLNFRGKFGFFLFVNEFYL